MREALQSEAQTDDLHGNPSWQQEIEMLTVDEEMLEKSYVEVMEPQRFDAADLQVCIPEHHFALIV